ncbi:MAG TPA: hypothetical protein VFK05_36605 [Polyangiaceae bacterium]|nr:hypothetical protein [Polyangiaceae bacterium]
MNVWEARVVVRERSLAEIVDLAVRFSLVLGAGLYLRLAACLLLPSYALCWWLLHRELSPVFVGIVGLALYSLLQLPFTVAAGRLMFSARVSLAEVLASSLRLLFRATLARCLALLLIVGGTSVVILAPLALARALYLGEVVVLEGAGAWAAYRRTTRVTSRRVPETFGVWLTLVATSATFIALTQIFASALSAEGLDIEALPSVWAGLNWEAGIAGLFLSVPLVSSLRFLSYIDNRTRREGWDIQVRFLELGRALSEDSL